MYGYSTKLHKGDTKLHKGKIEIETGRPKSEERKRFGALCHRHLFEVAEKIYREGAKISLRPLRLCCKSSGYK
jgi:hypothetical protein